ncbi:hypothetical protein ABFS82_02G098300 [Erythranthe guttata]
MAVGGFLLYFFTIFRQSNGRRGQQSYVLLLLMDMFGVSTCTFFSESRIAGCGKQKLYLLRVRFGGDAFCEENCKREAASPDLARCSSPSKLNGREFDVWQK